MKRIALIALAMALPAFLQAQDAAKPEKAPRPPQLGALAIFDTNKDGVLDEQEIANASAALKAIANSEGKVTGAEVRTAMQAKRAGDKKPAGERKKGGFKKKD